MILPTGTGSISTVSPAGEVISVAGNTSSCARTSNCTSSTEYVICPLYHERIPYLVKPQVAGPGMEPDKNGVRGPHWPDGDYVLGEFLSTTYVKNM